MNLRFSGYEKDCLFFYFYFLLLILYNLSMSRKYYLIRQKLPYLEDNIIKIYEPCNLIHLQKFISFMIGEIYVYLYDEFDNSRIDLTSQYGVSKFDIFSFSFEKVNIQTHVFKNRNRVSCYFKIYAKSTEMKNQLSSFFYGDDYEEFISNKYKELGYQVFLNGKKSFNDGGLDIIAKKNNSMVLVQCKNWSMSNKYKISQKDLRAFIGDCYLYLLKNPTQNKVSFHFIVSHNNILTKSANIFLKENIILKFKCVPFEKNNFI